MAFTRPAREDILNGYWARLLTCILWSSTSLLFLWPFQVFKMHFIWREKTLQNWQNLTLIFTEKLDVCCDVIGNGVLLHCFLCDLSDLKNGRFLVYSLKQLLHVSLYVKSYHESLCTRSGFVLLLRHYLRRFLVIQNKRHGAEGWWFSGKF